MIDLTTSIIPYEGTGIFKLDSSYDEVKILLQEHSVSYTEEIWKKTATFVLGLFLSFVKKEVLKNIRLSNYFLRRIDFSRLAFARILRELFQMGFTLA